MRYQKIVKTDGTETARYDYVYSDRTLILLTYTANGASNTARFVYDFWGEPRGFMLNDSATYLYLKNAQGDITAIVDENGEILVRYTYNAWGAVDFVVPFGVDPGVTTILATVSPFTYRGYCYDYDIGMYYLQSRYYDPTICRFINADSTDYLGATGTLLSYNLFAYCENEPVNYIDETGLAKKSKNNSESKKIAQNLCKAITIGILASYAIAQAPMAKHIMTMKKLIINYGFTKRYNLSTISIYAYTKKWYYLEEYDILSFGTTRENWYDLYDDINALLSLESITGVVVSVVALTKILPKLIAIAEILAVPVSIVVIMVSSAASKLEKKLRTLKDGDWYQFNWYVKRRYTPLFGNTKEEYLSYYSPLATIS